MSLSENLVSSTFKISSIWSLLTTFRATLRLLLYNSLLRGGYPSTLLNPLRSSLSTAAWARLLIQPHHTARRCQNADSGLQAPPKSTTPLFSSTVPFLSLVQPLYAPLLFLYHAWQEGSWACFSFFLERSYSRLFQFASSPLSGSLIKQTSGRPSFTIL